VFAERGWRDALSFVSNQQAATAVSRPEDVLEIRSLQHEINVLQRQIMKRAQMADEFQRVLTFSTDELEQATNQLMTYLHAEVPLGKTHYAPPLWTVDFPSDSDVSSSSQLTRLGRLLRKLQAVTEWVKENNLEKFPHYEALMRELNPTPNPAVVCADDLSTKVESKKAAPKKKKKAKASAKPVEAEETASVSVKSAGAKSATAKARK